MIDKSLEDKKKTESDRRPDAASGARAKDGTAAPAPNSALGFKGEGIGAYGRNSTELTQKMWDESKLAWNETSRGRLAIRLFSRGIMGAAFFAGGNLLTQKWMGKSDAPLYNPLKPLEEQKNPLQIIAKIIDEGVGKPIEALFGREAVHFRPTVWKYSSAGGSRGVAGRSLGHEVVGITFDFFCASVGDAWARDIVGWVDPNVKKSWIRDGKIDFPAAVKQMFKSTWQYISYNGGEDWAVAIPYAYFMKAQRAMISHPKISPGFEKDFDFSQNGNIFKVNDDKKVIGNYMWEGAMDLQGRFTVYNMGTLMYREAYDYAANLLQGKKASLYGAPDAQEHKGFFGKTADTAKWVVRSIIKGGLYMTPAVPAFWVTRSVQSRDTEFAVNPMRPDIPIAVVDGNANPHFDPHATEVNLIGKGFDKVGKYSSRLVERVDNIANRIDTKRKEGLLHAIKDKFGILELNKFSNTYTKAAISYTPYMYAKAEFARLWDHGKMDMALERMIDGAVNLNWGEFKAGTGEVYKSVVFEPLADPAREAEGQRRIALDTSLPADVNLNDERMKQRKALEKEKFDWRQRVVQGKPETKQTETTGSEKPAMKPASYVDQEELRKALHELTPPTSSIH